MGSGKTGCVFAGQGAQYVGMGKDLHETFPECRALFEQANNVLNFDITKLCFEGPEEELVKTENCQPAIFLVGIACFKAYTLSAGADNIAGFAGLSLGEWSALHAAKAISFEDCLRALAARGKFMQDACEEQPGAMLSLIGMSDENVRELAAETDVSVANFNSPGQTVLSGRIAGIEKAEQLAKEKGAKRAVRLNVAGAYHSPLMNSASEKLREFIETIEIKTPAIPVFSNVTGKPHGSPEEIKKAMVDQVTSSVDWIACVKGLAEAGATRMIEFGPGKVLSGLIKRIDSSLSLCNVQDRESLEKTSAC